MNPFLPRTCAAIAATVALSTAATVIPQAAHAFDFSVESGTGPKTEWNKLPTTVIDFSSQSNSDVPTSPTTIATDTDNVNPDNGSATIRRLVTPPDNNDDRAFYTDVNELFSGGGRYLNIGSNNPSNTNGSGRVLLSFDAPKGLGYFGLYWASPSANDKITFNLRDKNGNTSGAAGLFQVSYFGSDIIAKNLSITTNRYVNFFATNNGAFANMVIASVLLEDLSSSSSFEVDNIAYQVIPTPALLPGLVALGAGLARKKKAQAEAEA